MPHEVRAQVPAAQQVPRNAQQEVEQRERLDATVRARQGLDADPDYRPPGRLNQVDADGALPHRATRSMTGKRLRDESENDVPSAKRAISSDRVLSGNMRTSSAKRDRDESGDHDSPNAKRVFLNPQGADVGAAQPLRRSLRLVNRLCLSSDKRDLDDAEPGPSEKRSRVLPAEQELMQIDAIRLAWDMFSG